MNHHRTRLYLAAIGAAALLTACAGIPSSTDLDRQTEAMVKASFHTKGIAGVERITATDSTLKACDAADVAGKPIDKKLAEAIEATEKKTIKWPANGQFLGDWRQGEAIAQSGRGQTWTDTATTVNGGNCYNCHQIDKKEISFGTIGPSLWNYGKLRGVTDPASAQARPIVEYTWGKIYNAKAYNACSNMPRAGHMGVLNEQQIRHVMALLLDPRSPVNQ